MFSVVQGNHMSEVKGHVLSVCWESCDIYRVGGHVLFVELVKSLSFMGLGGHMSCVIRGVLLGWGSLCKGISMSFA